MEITDLLISTQKNNASDLHLSTGNPPILRIHGEMMPYKAPPMSGDDVKRMLHSIMSEQQRADYERDLELDFAISFSDSMRFRVNAFNTMNGPAAVLRTIPNEIQSLEAVGAPEILKKLSGLHKGLILVTGPTGSGKSTTLAAMVDYINSNESKHIITIEDPVEFVHMSKKSLINQREVGRHTHSFAKALRSALREDPDVILVGELRDAETIRWAMTAAETGHLVLGTLHTTGAVKTIDRIVDALPADEREQTKSFLSQSLIAVVTQVLVKTADQRGRKAICEIMIVTRAIGKLIMTDQTHQIPSQLQTGKDLGMQMLDQSLLANVTAKEIDPDDAYVYAQDKRLFARYVTDTTVLPKLDLAPG